MLAENFTLTEEMRDELIEFVKKVIYEHVYMDDLDMLKEDDQYYNWYYGYSFRRSYFDKEYGQIIYYIFTSATSGSVTTQYFGEEYQLSLVERNVYYQVFVYPPEKDSNSNNVTLHFNLEKLSMTGLSTGYDNTGMDSDTIEAELTSIFSNFTPPGASNRSIFLSRSNINEEDVRNSELEAMPGFRLSWYYTGLDDNVSPDPKFSDSEENQLFVW